MASAARPCARIKPLWVAGTSGETSALALMELPSGAVRALQYSGRSPSLTPDRREILYDLPFLLGGDGGAVGLDHLVNHLRPLLLGERRLRHHVPRRVADRAGGEESPLMRSGGYLRLFMGEHDRLD